MSDESKSPEAETNSATAAGEAHAALNGAQAQAEVSARAVLAAVRAEVDARLVEAAAAKRSEAEARQATDAAAATRQANAHAAADTTVAVTTSTAAGTPFILAASGGVASRADVLRWLKNLWAFSHRYGDTQCQVNARQRASALLLAFDTPSPAARPRPHTSRSLPSSLCATSPTTSRPCTTTGARGSVIRRNHTSRTTRPSGKICYLANTGCLEDSSGTPAPEPRRVDR